MRRGEKLAKQGINAWSQVKVVRGKLTGMLTEGLLRDMGYDYKPNHPAKFGMAVINTRDFRGQRNTKNRS